MIRMCGFLFLAASILAATSWGRGSELVVGSKQFTESVILGEIVQQYVASQGDPVRHQKGLGGSRVLWNALLNGDIDFYPEYTGTLSLELLAKEGITDEAGLRRSLSEKGLAVLPSLGFENTYAIGVTEKAANQHRLHSLSDLSRATGLRFGLSNEFVERSDGWKGLRQLYGIAPAELRTMDHEIGYRAIDAGEIDAIDLYSTDAEIAYYKLRVLEDDRDYFPPYRAVLLYRTDLQSRNPRAIQSLKALVGKISQREMIEMNARSKIDHLPEGEIATRFLASAFHVRGQSDNSERDLRHFLMEHIVLVLKSMFFAILVAVPLGILAWWNRAAGQIILTVVGLVQTIPALALLVLLIQPLRALGLSSIGEVPAIVALFLYSLLPIVRNTHSGLKSIPPSIRESANALGLSTAARIWRIYLPIASPMILAGIKTSAVINVGFATLGALIGAGGLGQPILTGIRLDDPKLISEAAGLSAALALAVQLTFEIVERSLVPRGLRL